MASTQLFSKKVQTYRNIQPHIGGGIQKTESNVNSEDRRTLRVPAGV